MDNQMKDRVNEYLDDVREMGQINMFGAAPLIEEEFGLSRVESRKYLINWMDTFSEREINN